MQANHVCLQDTLKQPCPVCSEFLFDSTRPISVLPGCGHTIHKDCQQLLDKNRLPWCPLCLRTPEDIEATKGIVAGAVELHHGCADQDIVEFDCLECRLRSSSLLHAFGQQCESCGSFNTRIARKVP